MSGQPTQRKYRWIRVRPRRRVDAAGLTDMLRLTHRLTLAQVTPSLPRGSWRRRAECRPSISTHLRYGRRLAVTAHGALRRSKRRDPASTGVIEFGPKQQPRRPDPSTRGAAAPDPARRPAETCFRCNKRISASATPDSECAETAQAVTIALPCRETSRSASASATIRSSARWYAHDPSAT